MANPNIPHGSGETTNKASRPPELPKGQEDGREKAPLTSAQLVAAIKEKIAALKANDRFRAIMNNPERYPKKLVEKVRELAAKIEGIEKDSYSLLNQAPENHDDIHQELNSLEDSLSDSLVGKEDTVLMYARVAEILEVDEADYLESGRKMLDALRYYERGDYEEGKEQGDIVKKFIAAKNDGKLDEFEFGFTASTDGTNYDLKKVIAKPPEWHQAKVDALKTFMAFQDEDNTGELPELQPDKQNMVYYYEEAVKQGKVADFFTTGNKAEDARRAKIMLTSGGLFDYATNIQRATDMKRRIEGPTAVLDPQKDQISLNLKQEIGEGNRYAGLTIKAKVKPEQSDSSPAKDDKRVPEVATKPAPATDAVQDPVAPPAPATDAVQDPVAPPAPATDAVQDPVAPPAPPSLAAEPVVPPLPTDYNGQYVKAVLNGVPAVGAEATPPPALEASTEPDRLTQRNNFLASISPTGWKYAGLENGSMVEYFTDPQNRIFGPAVKLGVTPIKGGKGYTVEYFNAKNEKIPVTYSTPADIITQIIQLRAAESKDKQNYVMEHLRAIRAEFGLKGLGLWNNAMDKNQYDYDKMASQMNVLRGALKALPQGYKEYLSNIEIFINVGQTSGNAQMVSALRGEKEFDVVGVNLGSSAEELTPLLQEAIDSYQQKEEQEKAKGERLKELRVLSQQYGFNIFMWSNLDYDYIALEKDIANVGNALAKLDPQTIQALKGQQVSLMNNKSQGIESDLTPEQGLTKTNGGELAIEIDADEPPSEIAEELTKWSKELVEGHNVEDELSKLTVKYEIKGVITWSNRVYDYSDLSANIGKIDTALSEIKAANPAEFAKLKEVEVVMGMQGIDYIFDDEGLSKNIGGNNVIVVDYKESKDRIKDDILDALKRLPK